MMETELFLPLVGGCTTASILLLLLGIRQLALSVPEDDREFMDPLPSFLRLIWPLVRIIAYYVCAPLVPFAYLQHLEERLRRTGISYLMMAEEYVALRLLAATSFLFFGLLILRPLGQWNPLLWLVLPLLGFFYPDIWVRDRRKKQVDGILRTLPAYLDFITMAVEAGLNFSAAIEQARKKAPSGPLVIEFGIVLRDLRAGVTRSQALRRMADRLDILEVNSFVNAVIQAEKMGSNLASVLKIQAEQRRNERFQRAEKKAMEAPVKLIGPLILFIFPTTFIVLAFPIVVKLMQEGIF